MPAIIIFKITLCRETHRKKKVTTLMRFPEELDMTEFVSPQFRSGERLIYKLTAVLIHNGKSASSGHYVGKTNWGEFILISLAKI
jgi:uncharacterized UBP type Zn finger protein